jgi:TRAP-type C4-dicarboxylate transport system permease small subunit
MGNGDEMDASKLVYVRARKRVAAKFGFFVHATVFVAVMATLIYVNLTASPGTWWFQWPLLGWGIGLAFHAFSVYIAYGTPRFLQRMIERETARITRRDID